MITEGMRSGPLKRHLGLRDGSVSKLYFALRCTASWTWRCARLASSVCMVIFVSVECHCSPLSILESLGVAVGGEGAEGDTDERHATRGETAGKHMFCC